MKRNFFSRFFQAYPLVAAIAILLCVFAAVQSCYLQGVQVFVDNGLPYTFYNNYIVFKKSFFHLITNQDLYQLYPLEHWDFFKYSPTFSLFFGFFAWMPDIYGLVLWNVLNALILLIGIKQFPEFKEHQKTYMIWFVLIELLCAQQNEQSNALMVGLIVWGFALAEKKNFFWAMLLIVCSAFIKIFGLVGLVIFLFYPNKFRNMLYFVGLAAVLFLLPLVVICPDQLFFLYKNWGNLLRNDHSASFGLSIYGWLQTWFGCNFSKTLVLFIGSILLLISLLRVSQYKNFRFRIWVLASTLIWIIIFNHKAESPTFIIAVVGVAIWYFSQARALVIHKVLFALTFVFTVLSTSDLFPPEMRKTFFLPYVVKVVPCILVWFMITYQLLVTRNCDNLSAKRGGG